ncbi:MAG: T9SS type A sorting domain-containing protein [Chitinophagales bacterium]|nr:T9SS type A sorting domain-containing protein [Chitinophagales bacterium]
MKNLFFATICIWAFTASAAWAQSCVGTANLAVTIVPPPSIPTITVSGDNLVSSSATGNQWLLNGTPIAGATGQSYNPTQAGNYSVEVNIDGCTATSSALFSTAATSLQLNNSVSLHPNPSTIGTTICSIATTRNETATVLLFDPTGKLLYQTAWSLQAGSNDIVLPIQQLSKGMYYLQLRGENWYNVQKLVKQ